MTRNRRFKKRVRARIAHTGESYSTACRRLRQLASEELMQETLTTLNGHDFGYQIDIHENWRDVGTDRYNSPFEVARYVRNNDRLHDGIVNIFWDLEGDNAREVAARTQAELKAEGVTESELLDVTLGDRPAVLHAHAYPLHDIEHWASRTHYIDVGARIACVNLATEDIEADAELFDRIGQSFRAVDDAVGIVLSHDDAASESFVKSVLVDVFNYVPAETTRRCVRIRAQRESIVAMVDRSRLADIEEDLASRGNAAGHPLQYRVVG